MGEQARDRVYVIAEAGVNHNGDMALARDLVAAAADAGADCVKFQTFRAESLVSAAAPKAEYQLRHTDEAESQMAMLRRLELPREAHQELREAAEARGLDFLSTPFDVESLGFLVGELGLPRVKIPSGEVTNGPLLLAAARADADVLLSTGMASLGEVEEALGVLAFGYLHPDAPPSRPAFRQVLAEPEAWACLARRVQLFQCTTQYPTPYDQVDLGAMATLRGAFGLRVGLSDHTAGFAIPLAAVALGAALIEKHFTLDRGLPGPDHAASLEPGELAAMVEGIRQVEQAVGGARKHVRSCELANAQVARKSLAARVPIAAGELFSAENLTALRPEGGRSPMRYWEVLGTPAPRAYAAGELLE